MNDLIAELRDKEPLSTQNVIAFMSYNPSIGRVLQKDGLSRFQEMVLSKVVPDLLRIRNKEEFDNFHDEWIDNFRQNIKRDKRYKDQGCSYGHAQKAINVFLKVFVYWSKRPDGDTADTITPFLHVPLDKILMKFVKGEFRKEFKEKIGPKYHNGFDYSLTSIEKSIYRAWQELFRDLCPDKPILLDVIWAVYRFK